MGKGIYRLRMWWVAVIVAVLLNFQPAHALDVPPLKGRVNDLAGMINPSTQRQMESTLTQLERTDSTQVVVLTIPSLKGDSLEEFSLQVAETWRIGQKNVDNGALLLISKNDRKIRIEVGFGLEGKLTDLVAGRIIRNVMVPQFKMGRFDQGISEGVSAIVGVVRGEYTAPASPPNGGQQASPSEGIVFGLFILVTVLSSMKRIVGAVAGGVVAPIAGALFFGTGVMGTLLLIPVGIAAGLILGGFSFGPATGYRGGRGHGGGGFGGGGFSGGGGGFGGGGASGGW